ncbi:MAG: hypothetical protein GYA55_09185 [SAR324 cluster bacterium]|uniref:Uncharacterized protein n=1 Tax=SAR324 cluster bacterium TaxID=2024889 RepID=A0A7X9FSZ1_9DELT|nr:hypothetical protein [SAR324 cluster bacterium]
MKRLNLPRYAALNVAFLAIGTLSSCSATNGTEAVAPIIVHEQAPGVVQEVWEEPMVDVIDVPPGLDPEGIYYRPGHQEVVEIRQGRWQYYNKNKE